MTKLFTLLLIVMLASCGGGGSSNSSEPTELDRNNYSAMTLAEIKSEFAQLRNSKYRGATELVAIQESNIGDFASAFFHSMDGFTPAPSINEITRSNASEKLKSPLYAANKLVKSVLVNTTSKNASSRSGTMIDKTVQCDEGGSMRMAGTLSGDGQGVVNINYDECAAVGTTLDGYGAMYITAGYDQKLIAFYEDIKSSSKVETTYITGSMDEGFANQGSITFDLVISDATNIPLYQVKDYIISDGSSHNGPGTHVEGRLYVPAHGHTILSTRKNFIPNTTNYFDSDAEFEFSGASSHTALLTIVDQQVLLSVTNPDTSDTKYAIAGKYDLLEAPGNFLPLFRNGTEINWAPKFNSIEFMQTSFDTTHDIKVQLEGLNDAEGNFVEATFQWYLNGQHLEEFGDSQFPSRLTTQGDVVMVVVSLHDGFNNIKVSRLVAEIGASNSTLFVQNLPDTIQRGAQLTFQVLYGNPDSNSTDQKNVSLSYGPDGMSISESGIVTWRANSFQFRNEQIVRFGFSIQGESLTRHYQIKIVDPEFTLPIARTSLDIPSEWNSLKAIQFDNDSEEELLIISGKQQLYVLGDNGQGLVQEWMYPYTLPGGDLKSAVPVDLNSDGISEIIVASTHQIDLIKDRNSIAEKIYNAGTHTIYAFAADDIDQDGIVELVVLLEKQLLIVTMEGTVKHQIELDNDRRYGRKQILIANTDGDIFKEIVLADGYVLDGKSLETQWDHEKIFGDSIVMGDFNGDGRSDIIGLFNYADPVLYDPASNITSIILPELKNCFVSALNIDMDIADELVVSCWPNREVKAFNLAAGKLHQIAVMENVTFSSGGFTLVDINGDSISELFWTGSNNNSNNFFIASVTDGTIIQRRAYEYPKLEKFRAAGFADQRNDAGQAVYIAWNGNREHSGQSIATLKNGELQISPPVDRELQRDINGIVVDYDSDGRSDVVMKADKGFEAQLEALRIENFSESASFSLPSSSFTPTRLTAADFNKDGFKDIVAANHNTILAVDLRNNSLLLERKNLALQTNDIVAGQGYFIYSAQDTLQRWDKTSNGFIRGASGNQGCSRLAIIHQDYPKESIACLAERKFGSPQSSELKIYTTELHQQQSVEFQYGAREILIVPGNDDQLRFLATYTNSTEFNSSSVVLKMFSINGFLIWESEPLFGWLSPKSLHRQQGTSINNAISVATEQGMFLITN